MVLGFKVVGLVFGFGGSELRVCSLGIGVGQRFLSQRLGLRFETLICSDFRRELLNRCSRRE